MNRSYSKKRHIQEANILLEQRTNKTFMTESQKLTQDVMKKDESDKNNPELKTGTLKSKTNS
jgi:hypothetical protein